MCMTQQLQMPHCLGPTSCLGQHVMNQFNLMSHIGFLTGCSWPRSESYDINSTALLCAAVVQVPQDQWQHTPIQLMATAGMRMLKNGSAERIMAEVGHLCCVKRRDRKTGVRGCSSPAGEPACEPMCACGSCSLQGGHSTDHCTLNYCGRLHVTDRPPPFLHTGLLCRSSSTCPSAALTSLGCVC